MHSPRYYGCSIFIEELGIFNPQDSPLFENWRYSDFHHDLEMKLTSYRWEMRLKDESLRMIQSHNAHLPHILGNNVRS